MTTAEKLYQVTKKLSEPALAELLDFAEFLSQRHNEATSANNAPLTSIKGGLEHSKTFLNDALTVQQSMRDEWH